MKTLWLKTADFIFNLQFPSGTNVFIIIFISFLLDAFIAALVYFRNLTFHIMYLIYSDPLVSQFPVSPDFMRTAGSELMWTSGYSPSKFKSGVGRFL